MGFDFIAKKRNQGEYETYHANIFYIIVLRCAMLQAGVKEELIYKKFISNDNFFVTPLQSKTIAEKIKSWLQGRSLTFDVCEKNKMAIVANDHGFRVVELIGDDPVQKEIVRILRENRPYIIKVDKNQRKNLYKFAHFCEISGGFWVN